MKVTKREVGFSCNPHFSLLRSTAQQRKQDRTCCGKEVMGKINWQRVFLGGVLWAVIYNVIGWVIVSLANVVWGILFLRLPTGPMVTSLASSLVAVVAATIAGAWLYKEEF